MLQTVSECVELGICDMKRRTNAQLACGLGQVNSDGRIGVVTMGVISTAVQSANGSVKNECKVLK